MLKDEEFLCASIENRHKKSNILESALIVSSDADTLHSLSGENISLYG